MATVPCRLSLGRSACALALLLAVAPAAAASDRSVKLSPPLATEVGGGVVEARISADGAWVVFKGTQDSGVPGFFSAPVDGRGPTRRIVPADIGPISSWALSAKNELVFSDWRRLYVVPIDGRRAPLALTSGGEDGNIWQFQISASGEHVVYLTTDNLAELKSVRTDGSSAPVHLKRSVTRFVLDPHGERVAFELGTTSVQVMSIDGSSEAVRLGGAQIIPLSRPLLFSPAGDRVLYCAQQGSTVTELWSAPADGSQPALKLNGSIRPGGSGVIDYAISPDGTHVLYRADQDVAALELYCVPIDASQPAVKINATTRSVYGGFGFEAGSLNALYLSDEQDGALREPELYLSPTEASAPRELLPRIFDPSGSYDPVFVVARESRRVVYRALQGGVLDLYSVPLGHGETFQLTHTSDPAGGPRDPLLTPDGRTAVYLEQVAPSDEYLLELRAVPVDGSRDPIVLGGPFHPTTTASFQIAPDGKHVVLHAGLDLPGVRELFGAPLDGRHPMARIHAPLVTETVVDDVTSFEASPDGSQAVFTVRGPSGEPDDPYTETRLLSVLLRPGAVPVELHESGYDDTIVSYEQSSDGGMIAFVERLGDSEPDFALYSVPADGSRPALRLAPDNSQWGLPFHLTPDGNWVAFTDFEYERTSARVRSVSTSGGPVHELSGALVEHGTVMSSRMSPDGTRIVYVADALANDVFEIFSAPVDGSGPAVRLNPPLVLAGDVFSLFAYFVPIGYEISPDGSTVVYLADQDRNDRFELYRVPIDGSAASVKLNGALPNGGGVQPRFQISADGRWIVYIADQSINNRNELFAGPLDGSSPALSISGPLLVGGNVQDDFQLDPVRGRVVYRADQLANEVFELFSVALDGSEPAVRLSGPLAADDDVGPDFVVGGNGTRVLFRVDSETDGRFELHCATLGVADSAVRLVGDLAEDRQILPGFRLSTDGTFALFAADLDVDERFELWAVPSGGGKLRRVGDPFTSGGDVVRPDLYVPWEFELPMFAPVPGRAGVLYIADQDQDEALELYLGRLDRVRATPASNGALPRRGR